MLPACVRMQPHIFLFVLCALVAGPVRADTVTLSALYEATVPVAGTSERAQQAAFREALGDVLVRITGRRDAPDLESLAALVEDAARLVVSYRRAAGNRVVVSFDEREIENAIDAAGLSFWGAERPVVLVWLAVDRGDGRPAVVTATSAGEERQRVVQAAARRGLPLAWPDPGEDAATAARKHGADGVLTGRAAPGASAARPVEWSFRGAGTLAEATGVLETGPDLAADRYAALLASNTAGRRSEELVTVTGIDSLEAFAGVERALGRVRLVRDIALVEVTPDTATFRLQIRGEPQALLAALQRDVGLRLVDSSRMIFARPP